MVKYTSIHLHQQLSIGTELEIGFENLAIHITKNLLSKNIEFIIYTGIHSDCHGIHNGFSLPATRNPAVPYLLLIRFGQSFVLPFMSFGKRMTLETFLL